MSSGFHRTRIAAAVGAAIFAFSAGRAEGGAFALQEYSGSGLGNAFAGGAAVAEDASTVWSNPAGMSRLKSDQLVVAAYGVFPKNNFNNSGSLPAFNQPLGGDGGNSGESAMLGNVYFVAPIAKDWAFGIGFSAPFGLGNEYDSGWIGRYQGLKSEIKTYNLNPSVSWKLSDNFAIGVGANWQRVDATLTSNVNYSGALATAAGGAAQAGQITPQQAAAVVGATGGLDATTQVDSDDDAWGWNVGVLWDVSRTTRIGAQYRSAIRYNLVGNVNFTYPSLAGIPPQLAPIVGLLAGGVNNVLANGGVYANVKVPAIANVSLFSRLNDQWDVMADVQYTGWSSVQDLTFYRTSGALLQSTPENFRNTWRASIGANYRYDNKWMFRSGVAYDQTPVRDAYRTVRLPDGDRTWLSAGVQYAFSPALKLDVGATYVWVQAPDIDNNQGSTAAYGSVRGSYDSSVFLVAGQFAWSF